MFNEIFLGSPATAHILGGAVMGKSPEVGVIDDHNRVFNYKNMYVCDGSAISANPGVNPSLSITALTEHAMSKIPVLDEKFFKKLSLLGSIGYLPRAMSEVENLKVQFSRLAKNYQSIVRLL